MSLNIYGTTFLNDNELSFCLDTGLGIEIIQYMTWEGMNKFNEVKHLIDEYAKKSKKTSMHGICYDMVYSASDPMLRDIIKLRFALTFEIALFHGINQVVFHSTGNLREHRSETAAKYWIERCVEFWDDFYKYIPENMQILIENVDDTNPAALSAMIKAIGKPNIRCCFDVGHAYISSALPLDEWVDALGDVIAHIHLHDNNGKEDNHLTLGKGKIPLFKTLNRLIGVVPPDTPFVLECEKKPSMDWLRKHGFI